MIKTIEITNFKSIKHLKQDLKRVNIFIGEPNTGKSNILEALGLFCYARYFDLTVLRSFVRFERASNLFYDESLEEPLEIALDSCVLRLKFESGDFMGTIAGDDPSHPFANLYGGHDNISASWGGSSDSVKRIPPVQFYRFAALEKFDRRTPEYLLPPDGTNLLSLLLTQKELKSTANQVFSRFGLRMVLKPQENKIEVIKQLEDVVIAYPYSLTSDTLQRVIFYLSAVLSNKKSILVFEEPESHSFPYYTKYLAETIALDKNDNQYVISTHNPYFLLPLLQKTPKEDVAVFITYFRDYQTMVKPLSSDDLGTIMDIDVFSNLDSYLDDK